MTENDCDRWSRLLSAFLDRELPLEEGRALEAHLKTCDACCRERTALDELRAALAIPLDSDSRFVTRFRARRDESFSAARWQWWRHAAVRLIPLATAALLGAGTLWWLEQEENESLVELEAREIGIGISPLDVEDASVEGVLSIALEPFPGGIH